MKKKKSCKGAKAPSYVPWQLWDPRDKRAARRKWAWVRRCIINTGPGKSFTPLPAFNNLSIEMKEALYLIAEDERQFGFTSP